MSIFGVPVPMKIQDVLPWEKYLRAAILWSKTHPESGLQKFFGGFEGTENLDELIRKSWDPYPGSIKWYWRQSAADCADMSVSTLGPLSGYTGMFRISFDDKGQVDKVVWSGPFIMA